MTVQSSSSSNSDSPSVITRTLSLFRRDSKKQAFAMIQAVEAFVVIYDLNYQPTSRRRYTHYSFATTKEIKLASSPKDIADFVTYYTRWLKLDELRFLSTYQLENNDVDLVKVRKIATDRLAKLEKLDQKKVKVSFAPKVVARIFDLKSEVDSKNVDVIDLNIQQTSRILGKAPLKKLSAVPVAKDDESLRHILKERTSEIAPFIPLPQRTFADLVSPYTLDQFLEVAEQTLLREANLVIEVKEPIDGRIEKKQKYEAISDRFNRGCNKYGANFITHLLRMILEDKPSYTVAEIKDELLKLVVSENELYTSLSRDTFDLLSNGNVPLELFNAPQFDTARKDYKSGTWELTNKSTGKKTKRTFTLTKLKTEVLEEFKQVIQAVFKENDLQPIIDGIVDYDLASTSASTNSGVK